MQSSAADSNHVAFLQLCCVPLITSAAAYTLTITNDRTGSGTISGDIGCSLGPLGGCTPATFPDGNSLSLAAAPDWKSTFDGWFPVTGSVCVVSGTSCDITLNADTTVIARFSPDLQATILGNFYYYATLNEAYLDASPTGQSQIAAHVHTFQEDLTLGKSVYLYGGRQGPEYLTRSGETTLLGTLEIQQGAVVVDAMTVSALIVGQGSIEIDSLTIQ